MEIDIKNKKILTELIINSRIPINQLAKKVGISREVATYRINKLIQEKIILDFYTIIDIQKLGFSKAGCLIQFKGISKEKEKEFLDYLVEHEFVTYLGPLTGKWNLAFDIVYKDKEQLSSIIKELENKFTRFLDKILVISSGFEEESFPAKIFGSKKETKYKEIKKDVKADKIDLEILKELSVNSRIEYKELADKIKLSANAIKYRIKNLEKSGIILGYTLSVDFRKLQYEMYNIQIKKTSSKNEEELKKFLRQNSKVIYFYEHLGNENWDLDIGILTKNSSKLREFILELRENFGEIIRINDIYIIVEESKGNFAPQGIFKN